VGKSIDDTPIVREPGRPLKDEFQAYVQSGVADCEYGIRIMISYPGRVAGHTRWECQSAADKIINAMRVDDALVSENGAQTKIDNLNELQSLFNGRKDKVGFFEEIPNRYGPEGDAWYINQPWYKVHTLFGAMIVGWRKRVINIDWSGMPTVPAGKVLFPEVIEEGITVGKDFVHAWSLTKGQEYVNKIIDYCLTCPRVLTPNDVSPRSDY